MVARLVRIGAAFALAVMCSGCITAAVLLICCGGAALIAASSSNKGGANERYLVSKVESGVVSESVRLSYRYRIDASRVYKTAVNRHSSDDYLNTLAHENDGAVIFPELDAMYPGVFFNGSASIGIVVEMRIKDVYAHENAKCYSSLKADVLVKDATTGDLLGADGFLEELGWCQTWTNNCQDVSEFQTFRSEPEIAQGGKEAIDRAIFEGYAGAIVAILEKFENGGCRKPAQGNGARYVEVAARPSSGASRAESGGGQDNTVEAVNFFMGSMGAINSMNQAQRARHSARRTTYQAARQSQPFVPTGAATVEMPSADQSVALPKVCPVCCGSTKCRPCNGTGRIASLDRIAADDTSGTIIPAPRATAIMAASRAKCGPCGGTGKCRACNGTGKR